MSTYKKHNPYTVIKDYIDYIDKYHGLDFFDEGGFKVSVRTKAIREICHKYNICRLTFYKYMNLIKRKYFGSGKKIKNSKY